MPSLTPRYYMSTGECSFLYTDDKGNTKDYDFEGVVLDTFIDAKKLCAEDRLKECFNLLRRFKAEPNEVRH